jgi:hypothetical protein
MPTADGALPPVCGHSNDDARGFERRNVAQEIYGILRRPTQGMKNFAAVDHDFKPGA